MVTDRLVVRPKNLSGHEEGMDFSALIPDARIKVLILALVRATVENIIQRHAAAIQNRLHLALDLEIQIEALRAFLYKVEKGSEKIDDLFDLVDDTLTSLLSQIVESFTQNDWQLFWMGVAELFDLSSAQVQQLISQTSIDETRLERVKNLVFLYSHESSDWFQTLSSSFIALYIDALEHVEPNGWSQFLWELKGKFMNFLIKQMFGEKKKLVDVFQVAVVEKRLQLLADGEFERTIPPSWVRLAHSFKSPVNIPLSAMCQIIDELAQIQNKIRPILTVGDVLTSAHLELEPVQIFLELLNLRKRLLSDWSWQYANSVTHWRQLSRDETETLEYETVLSELLTGSISPRSANDKPANAFMTFTMWLNNFSQYENLDEQMSLLLDKTQRLTDVLDSVEFLDESTNEMWQVWYATYREELERVIDRMRQVILGNVLGEKRKRLQDPGLDEPKRDASSLSEQVPDRLKS